MVMNAEVGGAHLWEQAPRGRAASQLRAARWCLSALLMLASCGAALAAPQYRIIDLGTFGGAESVASGINALGQVVGYARASDGRNHAFITGPNGIGMTDLGTFGGSASSATAINASGQVVGSYEVGYIPDSHFFGFVTGPNGVGMTDLGSFAVRGLNDSGQLVGSSVTSNGDNHAFITGPNGVGLIDLGTLGGASYGNAINASGQVTGFSWINGLEHRAFITGPNGTGMTELALGARYSIGTGINSSGQVTGFTFPSIPEGPWLAFVTGANGVGATSLGTLGGTSSLGYGINDFGQVVGFSYTTSGANHAFVTGANGVGMLDLNALVIGDSPFAVLTGALGINDAAQIVGLGLLASGEIHAFLATPVPEPSSLVLLALCLAGLVSALRRRTPYKR